MQKLIFRLGPADLRTTVRVLEYVLDGKLMVLAVDAPARQMEIVVPTGSVIDGAHFHDEDEHGNKSTARQVLGHWRVGEYPPLAGGSCVLDRIEKVSPIKPQQEEPESQQAAAPEPDTQEQAQAADPEPTTDAKAE